MIADGQSFVEDGAFSANEFKERELGLCAVIVDASIEARAILRVGEETGFHAIERRLYLTTILGPGIHATVLAERRFVTCKVKQQQKQEKKFIIYYIR